MSIYSRIGEPAYATLSDDDYFRVFDVSLGREGYAKLDSARSITPTGGTTSRNLADWLAETATVTAFGAPTTRGSDAAAAINAAIASGTKTVFIPDGDYDLDTPIVPKSNVTVIASSGANLYQLGQYGIENPTNASVTRFMWTGGRFNYANTANPSVFDACVAMRVHNYCDIEIDCTGYDDRILVITKPTARVNLQNAVFNHYAIKADKCRIGMWLQGLEASYTEHTGDGTTGDLATTFNVTWPADLIIGVWEQSTGLLRLWELGTDYTIASGAAGTSGVAAVTPSSAVPSGDIVMMWPASATAPLCPISSDRYELRINDCKQAGIYAVRYADALSISGFVRLMQNDACHVWSNPLGSRNAETDFFNFPHFVAGQASGLTDSTLAVLRLGPGSKMYTGTFQFDKAYTNSPFVKTETDRVDLTGTVDVTNGSATVTGTDTRFTEELTLIGASKDRLWVAGATAADDKEYAIASVDSDTQITLSANATVTRSGVTGRKSNPVDGLSYDFMLTQFGAGGNSANPGRAMYKSGARARWEATIASGATSVFTPYPHRLNRTPVVREVRAWQQGDLGGVWCSAVSATGVTITCKTAPGADTKVTVDVELIDVVA